MMDHFNLIHFHFLLAIIFLKSFQIQENQMQKINILNVKTLVSNESILQH